MSLPKPKCPNHNGSNGVEKEGNRWYCSLCQLVFFAEGTGGAQKSPAFPIFDYKLPKQGRKQGKKKAGNKPSKGPKSTDKAK